MVRRAVPPLQSRPALVLAAGLITGGLLAAGVLAATAGCGGRVAGHPAADRPLDTDRKLIAGYFTALNTAAARGSAAQERLFADTQHPDVRGRQCALHGLTVLTAPAYSTLHLDADWRPPQAGAPLRGRIYVLAATVTVQQDAAVVGSQIGSLHVVVLDGTAYGFTPCPA